MREAFTDLTDAFERADGPLGTADSGQAWTLRGDGTGEIQDGRFVPLVTPPGLYAGVDLGSTTTRMEGVGSWVGPSGNSSLVFICSHGDGGELSAQSAAYANMLHCVIGNEKYAVQVYESGEASEDLDAATYAGGSVVADGTPYSFSMDLDGDTITVTLPDGDVRVVTDSRIARVTGRHLIYQIYKTQYPDMAPRWDSVGATPSERQAAAARTAAAGRTTAGARATA